MNQTELTTRAEALLDKLPDPENRIGKHDKLSRAEDVLILRLNDEGRSQTEIAQLIGCHQSTVSRVLAEFADTKPIARRRLHAHADTFAKRLVKDANPKVALEILQGLKVIDAPRAQDSGARGPQVIVMMPGQSHYVPETIDLSPSDFRLESGTGSDAK